MALPHEGCSPPCAPCCAHRHGSASRRAAAASPSRLPRRRGLAPGPRPTARGSGPGAGSAVPELEAAPAGCRGRQPVRAAVGLDPCLAQPVVGDAAREVVIGGSRCCGEPVSSAAGENAALEGARWMFPLRMQLTVGVSNCAGRRTDRRRARSSPSGSAGARRGRAEPIVAHATATTRASARWSTHARPLISTRAAWRAAPCLIMNGRGTEHQQPNMLSVGRSESAPRGCAARYSATVRVSRSPSSRRARSHEVACDAWQG